ncbi:hypothetical protein KJA14_01245 [Patescibacteria group bacterium]|nr:hypothetical protein [Patescibacteria group bacterium]
MKRREIVGWRWELEEPKKEIIVPTLKEKKEKGLSDEEWIMICYEKYKDSKCFREYSGHKLCKLCPKSTSGKKKTEDAEWAKDVEVLLSTTASKLVSRRR